MKLQFIKWILIRLYEKFYFLVIRNLDKYFPSFKKSPEGSPFGITDITIKLDENRELPINIEVIKYYLEHRFNLLGSGWKRVFYGMECDGFNGKKFPVQLSPKIDKEGNWLKNRINEANLNYSQKIWKLIYKANAPKNYSYSPIDWQIDFKSGFRWSEKVWYKDINYGKVEGADIKVPWELARMQHLPQLAIAFAIIPEESEYKNIKDLCFLEFRNQTLDFIATNPPRWGVNWACTMDVAIRAANMILAYEIFRANGAIIDNEFKNIFKETIYNHAFHISKNLEWHPKWRNNHYLADIAGLLYACLLYTSPSPRDS